MLLSKYENSILFFAMSSAYFTTTFLTYILTF